MQQFFELPMLAVCTECEKIYGVEDNMGVTPKSILPCGHQVSELYLQSHAIVNNIKASNMLMWLYDNGFIEADVYEYLEERGGELTPNECIYDLPTEQE